MDLAPGAYSNIGIWPLAAQIAGAQARVGPNVGLGPISGWARQYDFTNNLGIAFSTTIENVLDGAGADTLYGEGGPDWGVGGQDQDLLHGGVGDDIVYGNLGNDTVLVEGRRRLGPGRAGRR